MASNLKRRIEQLEAKAAANAPLSGSRDPTEVQARLEASEATRKAYEAASVEEKIATRQRQLEELKASQPVDCLHRLRIRLVEIEIEGLRGLSAEACDALRLDAHYQVGGRSYEPWTAPPPREPSGLSDGRELPDDTARSRRRARTMRDPFDPLADYKDEGRMPLEPRYH
jgi:hypothetical protein